MSLLNTLLSGQNGAIVGQLASQFGLDNTQVEAAMKQMVPALSGGIKKQAQNPQAAQGIMQSIQNTPAPANLGTQDIMAQGNEILGQVFGNKDVSRQVTGRAAEQTGIDQSILKQMLPVLATTVMGNLGGQPAQAANANPAQGLLNQVMGGGSKSTSNNPLMDMVGNALDADNDGDFMDDILGMIGK